MRNPAPDTAALPTPPAPTPAAMAPVAVRVTAGFAASMAAWGLAFATLAQVVQHRPGGLASIRSSVLVPTLQGSPARVGCTWAVALAAAMVVHEFGHAAAARRVGARNISVELRAAFGRTSYVLDDPWSWRRVVVVAAGALAPAMFAPLAFVPSWRPVAIVGVALALVNLVPVPVSDGGHLVAIAVTRILGDDARAERVATVVDLTLLGLAFVASLALRSVWLFAVAAPLLVVALVVVLTRVRASQWLAIAQPETELG
jgi:Zn-dependent protease